jgi:hypothetical protein
MSYYFHEENLDFIGAWSCRIQMELERRHEYLSMLSTDIDYMFEQMRLLYSSNTSISPSSICWMLGLHVTRINLTGYDLIKVTSGQMFIMV